MPILKLVTMKLYEGCKVGLDVDTHGHMHDTCKLGQRARIDKFLNAALLRVDMQNVQSVFEFDCKVVTQCTKRCGSMKTFTP